MTRRLLPVPLLVVCIALLTFAGCGSSPSKSASSSQATSTPAPATTSGGAAAASAGGIAVKMQNIAFSPTTIHVKVGQKITWTNEDSVEHNVTSRSGERMASANFGQGATFSFTPTRAGTIHYVCTIHPGMDGTIIVTK